MALRLYFWQEGWDLPLWMWAALTFKKTFLFNLMWPDAPKAPAPIFIGHFFLETSAGYKLGFANSFFGSPSTSFQTFSGHMFLSVFFSMIVPLDLSHLFRRPCLRCYGSSSWLASLRTLLCKTRQRVFHQFFFFLRPFRTHVFSFGNRSFLHHGISKTLLGFPLCLGCLVLLVYFINSGSTNPTY